MNEVRLDDELLLWSAVNGWVLEECPEQPEEPSPLFKCDLEANAEQVARVHNSLIVQVKLLRDQVDKAEKQRDAALARAERAYVSGRSAGYGECMKEWQTSR